MVGNKSSLCVDPHRRDQKLHSRGLLLKECTPALVEMHRIFTFAVGDSNYKEHPNVPYKDMEQ